MTLSVFEVYYLIFLCVLSFIIIHCAEEFLRVLGSAYLLAKQNLIFKEVVQISENKNWLQL